MCDLFHGMHPGISTSGTDKADRMIRNESDCLLKVLLNRDRMLLLLPA
jgi:hypothetical protein